MKKAFLSMNVLTQEYLGVVTEIAAVLYDERGSELGSFLERCPLSDQDLSGYGEAAQRAISESKVVDTQDDLLRHFAGFYTAANDLYELSVVWQYGHLADAHLFLRLVEEGYMSRNAFPLSVVDMTTIVELMGYRGDTGAEQYAQKYALAVGCAKEHPLYRPRLAFAVYHRLLTTQKRKNEKK